MSKLRFSAVVLSIAAIPGLSNAFAQTTLDQPSVLPGQPVTQPQQPLEQPGQPNTLPGQITNQPTGTQTDQGDRYEARRVASSTPQQQGPTVKQALVQKLIKENEAEIELAKLAEQKSDNQEVKQLAQTLIREHQAFNQTLQQHAGQQHAGNSPTGQSQANRNTPPGNQAGTQSQLQNDATPRSAANTVPRELCQIGEQACDNALKMTKEMLGNYEGQDFNMAFLGQQTIAHTMMLAELQAIESAGPQELQPIVQQASSKVKRHLEETKQLAKKLQDDRELSGESNSRQ
ncbi:DUF4142 domain-containing protein [Novipirellula sp. SH528]|uniref:DUF4142 domain-containing protein n=1 Tax=Novipirellula sp. SH528 TaxID=3454466 RepID=UPI003F9F7AE5